MSTKTQSNRKSITGLRTALLLGAAASAALAIAPAALAAEADTETVVVTGSRIPRSDFIAESPVTVVSGEQINLAGNLDLGEVLRQDLGVGGGAGGSFGQSNVLNGGGATSIDLRDLGSDRVLNLINGRRIASFADDLQNEASDLSFIPMAMVDHVEILRDGASAIYGADAVSGVVNVILKKDFEGLQMSAQAGTSEQGDRNQLSLQAVMGANMNRGNIVLSAEYSQQDLVLNRDRDWAIPSISSLGASSYTVGSFFQPGGFYYFDGGNYWCTQPKVFGGDEITDVAFTAACPDTPGSKTTVGAGGRYDYALQQSILNGNQSVNVAAYGTYKVTPDIEFFVESEISTRHSHGVLDGNPVGSAYTGSSYGAYLDGWVIAADNPYNPYPGETAYGNIRPTSTVGVRDNRYDAQMLRVVSGFRGENLFGKFNWELSYDYTEVSGKSTTDATVNIRRLITISDPTLCAADPNCVAALQTGSLGALDAYRPGNWSQSEINYFKQVATSNSHFTLENVQGNIGGNLFDLPAGPLAVDVGFEYRREAVLFRPDSMTEAGESVANQTFSTNGSFTVREIYGEVNVPILANHFLAESLSVNLQGRAFDYSTFGSGAVYKAGLNWAVNDWLRFRATYGTSFRAPTLVDSFSGGTVSYEFIDDPCDQNVFASTGTATRQANCIAAGANPATFTQTAAQISVLSGGDIVDGTLDLQPERAITATFGTVIAPQGLLEGLRASVDYWTIHITKFITSVDTQTDVINACYDSVGMSAAVCSSFSRNPVSGQLTNLTSFPINGVGLYKTEGLDWTLSYGFDLYGGTLNLTNQMSWKLGYNVYYPGAGNCGGSSGACIPRLEGSLAADYDIDDFSFMWRMHFIKGMGNISVVEPNVLHYYGSGDYYMHDIRIRWNVLENTNATFGVNNLFGIDPPYVFNSSYNTNTALFGEAVVGRYFFLRVTTKL